MKLFLILLAIGLQVSAAALSQEITLSVKKAPFREVMQNLRIQTGYQFILQSSVLEEAKPVTITLHKIAIEDALKKIFEDQPFTYSISNKVVIIKKKETITNLPQDPVSDPIIIKGKVTDRNNKPLPGVNIRIKGRDIGTVTDVNGNYTLKTDGPATLLFTYIGFRSYEQKVNTKTEINISLEDISSQLDQVQVIAYGTTTKRYSTSNISTVKAEEIAKQPVSNILLALQGRVSGMFLNQTSGVSGADVKVRIQGENSLRNGNEAFYVIDGIPYTPQNLYSGISQTVMPGTGSTLSFLNPADVESIEILKDADATAIYGSRAANGAILITTKKGKSGVTKVDLGVQSGWGVTTRKMRLLNTDQFIEIRKEAIKNANRNISATDYDVNGTWDSNRYTDWQEVLTGNTSKFNNAQGSVSGGTEQTQFLAGVGYIRETSVFLGDFSDTKGNVHMNINHRSKDNKFNFTISTNYLQDINRLPTSDLTLASLILAPNAPILYNPDGTVNWQPLANSQNTITFTTNPAANLERKYKISTSNLLGNMIASYEIVPGLIIKSSFGYNKLESDEIYTSPQTSYQPIITTNQRKATYGTKKITSWIIEPQITYTKKLSNSNIDALLGSSFQSTNNAVQAIDGSNYANDAQLENISAAGTIVTNFNTSQSEYRYNAIFGRINYQFSDRYIVNVTARRDGSSRFGSENLFHSFYSIGGAWIFGDESFVRNNAKWLSFGKLRATYGTTGNDQIQNYQFLNLYDIYNINVSIPYQQIVGLLPTGHSNPYLQWEETRKINLGLDLGLMDNRILTNINYYRNRSSNQLLDYNLPAMTGFGSVLRNIPALVENKGWEFIVESIPLEKKNIKWSVNVNLTIPKTTLLKYPNLEESSGRDTYIIGMSPNIVKTYEMIGVNKETGFYEFKTYDGKITSTPNPETDRNKVLTLGPTLYGGINNSLSYKNVQISFLFQYVKQLGTNYKFGAAYPGIFKTNQPIDILERWQNNGDNKPIQQVNSLATAFSPFNTAKQSDAAYSDASYIRLKNISLSYDMPSNWIKKAHIQFMRIFIQGQNLVTLTKYKWGDPEPGIPGVLPPLKVLTTGIQLTL